MGVGPQYPTKHLYVAAGDLDALANNFMATFWGQASQRIIAAVTPVATSSRVDAKAQFEKFLRQLIGPAPVV
jgi:hypothetical protein